MKVDILDLQTLFEKQTQYEIPEFQRRYIWNKEDQWQPLWQDVQDTAESILDDQQDDSSNRHFMGAVVLQRQNSLTRDRLDRRIVVDGQQRLTTLQLLLDAAREQMEARQQEAAERISPLVLNQRANRGDDLDNDFKVWPTTGDQEAFRQTMRNELESEKLSNSLIFQCHNFFKLQVQQWLDANPQEIKIRSEALEETLARKLELAVLDLDKKDNPHIIFETLNARGTPLLESDLIKNMILHEASISGLGQKAAKLWCFDGKWWRTDIKQGRLSRPRIEAFLNYWLVLRTLKEIPANQVFKEFRDYSNKPEQSKSIQEIADDINNIGAVYHDIEGGTNPEIAAFQYRWKVMEMGILTPVLLWLLSSGVPSAQLNAGLRSLESYLVRRMVCRMTTKDYNNIFLTLLTTLEKARTSCAEAFRADNTITKYLGEQGSNARLWPTNHQFEDAFLNLPLYQLLTRSRVRMIMETLEGALRTDKSETKAVPHNLTIEHIMPQNWRENWSLQDDVEDKTMVANDRDLIVHSIGNLTLVNKRLNPKLSNAPWEEKREILSDHSVLFLNKALLDEAPDVWDEAAIEGRAKRLCQVATEVWPYANQI